MKTTTKKISELIADGVLEHPMDGNHGEKHPKTTDYVKTGIPFILVPDLIGGKVDLDNCNFISKEQAATLRKGFSKSGDVLFTHKATIGKVAIADTKNYPYIILTPQITYYRVKNKDILDNKYLYYYFTSRPFQEHFKMFASSGGTRAYLGITAQEKLNIVYPQIDAQRNIVKILSAYDDLIDNNTRRIALLERAAYELFREWFVRFRFPGHKSVKGETDLPQKWAYKTIGELSAVLQRGISPTYDDNGPFWVINQKCIRASIMDIDEARRHSKFYKEALNILDGDTVICSTGTGTLGRVGQVYGDYPNTTFDSHVTLVRAKETIGKHFLYYSLKNLQPWFTSMGIGSTNQQELYTKIIKSAKIVVPPSELMKAFDEQINSIHNQIIALSRATNYAISQRDLLLPRLMSGKLEV